MKKIVLPQAGIETLFGSHDANLKHIESLLDVRLSTHGNQLIVDGDREAESRVQLIFDQLQSLLEEGYELADADVKTAAAVDLMSGAPSPVDERQLRELHLLPRG